MSLKFNIDNVSDDLFMSITEGMAVASAAFDENGPETLLVIALHENGTDSVLAGKASTENIETLERLLAQLKERASEEAPDDALVLQATERN